MACTYCCGPYVKILKHVLGDDDEEVEGDDSDDEEDENDPEIDDEFRDRVKTALGKHAAADSDQVEIVAWAYFKSHYNKHRILNL